VRWPSLAETCRDLILLLKTLFHLLLVGEALERLQFITNWHADSPRRFYKLLRDLRPWRWRRYFPPKRWLTLNGLHGVIFQKMILFITTAVKTSNPTQLWREFVTTVLCHSERCHRNFWAPECIAVMTGPKFGFETASFRHLVVFGLNYQSLSLYPYFDLLEVQQEPSSELKLSTQ
jgi:hypothetical protein